MCVGGGPTLLISDMRFHDFSPDFWFPGWFQLISAHVASLLENLNLQANTNLIGLISDFTRQGVRDFKKRWTPQLGAWGCGKCKGFRPMISYQLLSYVTSCVTMFFPNSLAGYTKWSRPFKSPFFMCSHVCVSMCVHACVLTRVCASVFECKFPQLTSVSQGSSHTARW